MFKLQAVLPQAAQSQWLMMIKAGWAILRATYALRGGCALSIQKWEIAQAL